MSTFAALFLCIADNFAQAYLSRTSPSSSRRRRRTSRLKASAARKCLPSFLANLVCQSFVLSIVGHAGDGNFQYVSLPPRSSARLTTLSQRPPSLQQRRGARKGQGSRPSHGRARTTARRYLHRRARCRDRKEGASSRFLAALLTPFRRRTSRRSWERGRLILCARSRRRSILRTSWCVVFGP